MKQATLSDKEIVLEMLEQSFENNSTVIAFSRVVNGSPKIRPLLEYAFHYSLAREGVYLSDDRTCVAFFNSTQKKGRWMDQIYLLRFLIFGARLSKIRSIYRHFKKVKECRSETNRAYHFWFLASSDASTLKSSLKFTHELIYMAINEQCNVYAETSGTKNELVYKRYGFDTYNIVKNEELNLVSYLMKKTA